MPPIPLPPNTYPSGTPVYTAYTTCLAFQTHAPWGATPTPQVCARLLGYMIIYSPTPQGRANISAEINSCGGDRGKFYNLSKFYINNYLRSFRSIKGRTPVYSDHPSPPSFDEVQETIRYSLEETPKSHAEAKIAALGRDGYRCMATGIYDMNSAEKIPDIMTLANQNNILVRETHASHIFAPSISQEFSGKNEDRPKHNFAASAWAVTECTGSVLVPDELNGPDIHRLENVMTLEIGAHSLFDNLKMWFEATGTVQHQYRVSSTNAAYTANMPQTVTFTSTDQHLPLPDPRYLAFHAACAKVAHLSGAGQYVDAIDRDLESTKVLATGGSSADLLEAALGRLGRIDMMSVRSKVAP